MMSNLTELSAALALFATQQPATQTPDNAATVPVPAPPIGLPGAVPVPAPPVGLPSGDAVPAETTRNRSPAPVIRQQPDRPSVRTAAPTLPPRPEEPANIPTVESAAPTPGPQASPPVVSNTPSPVLELAQTPESDTATGPALDTRDPATAPPAERTTPWGILLPLVAVLVLLGLVLLGLVLVLVLVRRRDARAGSWVTEAPVASEPPEQGGAKTQGGATASTNVEPVFVTGPVERASAASAGAAPAMLTPAPRSPSEARAWIDLAPEPVRAGVNMLTATAELFVVVRNTGEAPGRGIRLDVKLLSARADQEAELEAVFAAPSSRPAVPPFDLEPGAEKRVRTIATLPRDAINVLKAGERPMFVPVVALNASYLAGAAVSGRTAGAYIIGVERAGATKLAPIWLDTPGRMHDALGQRPHAWSVRS